MKIKFEDGYYVECKKSNDKILLIIAAKDSENVSKKVINAVEITAEQLKQLVSDV